MAWKRHWKRHLTTVLLFLLVYAGVRTYQLSGYVQGEAPEFSATSIKGHSFNLVDYRGEPVLVYFWATWCPVCKLERGSIESLAEDYPVITVASWSEDAKAVQTYFDNEKLRRTTINDPGATLAGLYGVTGVPSFFILNGDGQIRFIERGYTTSIGLRARLWLAKWH